MDNLVALPWVMLIGLNFIALSDISLVLLLLMLITRE